ncbi:tetratricopeptide repeat (TPR)-like superfamily protein [Wolffia australiana]
MRISEISPDLKLARDREPLPEPLLELESLIKEAEDLSADLHGIPQSLVVGLSRSLNHLTSLLPLSDAIKLHIWKLSYRLWNACVDLSNAKQIRSDGRTRIDESQVSLRQAASDLLHLAGSPPGIPSPAFKCASFFHKTGLMWHELRRFDLAANCFERATDLTSVVQADRETDPEERKLLLEINLARARTAWEVADRNLAIALLNRSKNLLFDNPASYKALADQYLQFGKLELSDKSESAASAKLLNVALNLSEGGIEISRRPDHKLPLENLRDRCLRFLAAERLQAGDYEAVVKCVKVMREGCGKEEHPSVGFMALKAWIGLGKFEEAERELRTMALTRSVPDNVCVAAAELLLEGVGAEAAKGVLIGLVSRCRLGPSSALRVVKKVAEGGGGGRARVVGEVVSDERVLTLFSGPGAATESRTMHAVLWNCGAEHFRSEDYETASEIFEKSMLYITHDEENRPRRANCYRVLSLCYLGLSRLDRAQEFIDEATKLEPTINSVFLKYKVHLQRKAEKEAVDQIQEMVKCVDFHPEYLTLSAHEAMSSRCTPAAVAALLAALELYTPGREMPMPEVAVRRNLITLLQEKKENEREILKQLRFAKDRMSGLGAQDFFGKDAVGIRERGWLAGTAWNMGLKAGAEKKYGYCSEFLELASEFYGGNVKNEAMVYKSLILSVAAMISRDEQKQAQLTDIEVNKALKMLETASKLQFCTGLSVSPAQVPAAQNTPDRRFFFLKTFCAYQLLSRLEGLEDSRQRQLRLIKDFISSSNHPGSTQNLLQLGLVALQGACPNHEAAEMALNSCLSALLASLSPDYQMASIVIRKLIGITGLLRGENNGESAAYTAYQQAYRIIVGLKEGEYPAEEGKWLAMTAWNRAGSAVRLGHEETARKWMKMGLDLAQRLLCMDKYRKGMEDCLRSFEERCFNGEKPIDMG